MKSKLLAAMLIFTAGLSAARADTLADARARFADGEYEQAARLFEQSLDTPSATGFYELGRTYLMTKNTGRAALNFRRALVLNPGFSLARTALHDANVLLGISPGKSDWRTNAVERVPPDLMAVAGALSFWAGAFLLLAGIIHPRATGRLWGGALLLLVGTGLLCLVWMSDPRITLRTQALVLTTGGTTMLDAPAEQSKKVAAMPEGSVVRLLSQRGRWFYGELPGGAHGWFLTEGIIPVIPPE